MDRKTLTILLAAVLIGSFFLPYFKPGVSGYDIVMAKGDDSPLKYIWLLIPISGVVLLIGALNRENYIGGRSLWSWLPLLTIIFFFVKYYLDVKKGSDSVDLGAFVKRFDYGFWVALVTAFLLAFANPRRR